MRSCPLCGHLFRSAQEGCVPDPLPPAHVVVPVAEVEAVAKLDPGLRYLAVGVLLAPVFALTPLLQYMAWFLSALAHELGHSAVAWFFGSPSVPAIRLDGHAAAVHGDQMVGLVVLIAAGLAASIVRAARPKDRKVAAAVAAGLVGLYLAVALTPVRGYLFLLGGHGGELAIGGIFLVRCATGGFTESRAERGLYGVLGWYLIGKNVALSTMLLCSAAARAEYAGSGSFGLTNDYLRLGLPLEVVATGMGLVAIAVGAAVVNHAWRRPTGV